MESKTSVRNMRLRSRTASSELEITRPLEITPKADGWGIRFLQIDRLLRDMAVVGAMVLTIIAVKNADVPQAQSVFAALQTSANIEWDDSIGRLSFVADYLPDEIQAVWNDQTITVFEPMHGETIHVWTQNEPYITISSRTRDVRAVADGEVMSIAHGLNEEMIIRVRHKDGSEALYGNIASFVPQTGDLVYAGDVIAQVVEGLPLAFELRINGRSVDPSGRMVPVLE